MTVCSLYIKVFLENHIVGALTFQSSLEVTKDCTISSCCFLGNDTKKSFFTNWDRDNSTQAVYKTANFGKTSLFIEKIMNKKQVLVYGVLESTNDLRSVFVRHIHYKKPKKF